VPLNEAEIVALSAKLTDIPKIRIQIMYENVLGKELAQSFHEAFSLARWEGATLGIGSGLGPGITIGQGSGTATIALKSAIEAINRNGPGLFFWPLASIRSDRLDTFSLIVFAARAGL
jgi:hypothetical protein